MKITNIPQADPNWVVLEGSIAGCPAVTQRRSIHAGALADGQTTIATEVAALTQAVEKAYRNWTAAQIAIAALSQFETPN